MAVGSSEDRKRRDEGEEVLERKDGGGEFGIGWSEEWRGEGIGSSWSVFDIYVIIST